MALNFDDLKARVQNPKETLDTELKQWIDPETPEGEAKIAKACIALRNNNGGSLIIGFDDNGQPIAQGKPRDIRATYHADVIQNIVGKYALAPFPIEVEYIERDGTEYPVIAIPGGVETPVATKRDLPHPSDPKKPPLVRRDVLYVRTLASNQTVSTSVAIAPGDWDKVTKSCFDNREADIGAFIRRHLSTIDLKKLDLKVLGEMLSPPPPEPTAIEKALKFLDYGKMRFDEMVKRRNLEIPKAGVTEASVVIDGGVPEAKANTDFLWQLQAAKPNHTGWSPWIDLGNSGDPKLQPYVYENGWEAFVVLQGADGIFGDSVDFWRMEPTGKFYNFRMLEDDMPTRGGLKPPPNTALDFYLVISRTAEIISVGMSFAQSMGCDPKSTKVVFALRWSGLEGRQITSWAVPGRMLRSRGESMQDVQISELAVPLETPRTGIAPFVEQAVAPVLALFGGLNLDSSVIEGIVKETVSRRM